MIYQQKPLHLTEIWWFLTFSVSSVKCIIMWDAQMYCHSIEKEANICKKYYLRVNVSSVAA